ncbi:tripartite tricarboxylate transporter TctB family protein [uncultured Enterovirga sp.]|uniref:tripartite tricarboxylate transporter TctB family protein n=1 Tax=uncultured Enterovirga sp. TaxID=2026352 RepID=UPI0035CA3A02
MNASADRSETTLSMRTMEIVVAGLLSALALLVMYENWRIGAGWGEDGPGAGYFPFYIGTILLIASLGTIVRTLLSREPDRSTFVDRSQLKLVLQVFIPTIIYCICIYFTGIYVASALFITFFMSRLGKYPIAKVVPVAVLVPIAMFFMFEVWFKVPLPKGPLEAALGY